jgi:hypothetical protein
VRTGRNMVKYSSLNAPSTWLNFLCPRTHAKTSESLTFIRTREKVHIKCTMQCRVHFIITVFNVGNVLLCVIYQRNFTVFTYVIGLVTYCPWIRGHCCTLRANAIVIPFMLACPVALAACNRRCCCPHPAETVTRSWPVRVPAEVTHTDSTTCPVLAPTSWCPPQEVRQCSGYKVIGTHMWRCSQFTNTRIAQSNALDLTRNSTRTERVLPKCRARPTVSF